MRKTFGMILLIFCLLLYAGSVNAEFYEWVDEDGNVQISNTPVDKGKGTGTIKSLSGENTQTGGTTPDLSSYDWFNCREQSYRAGVEASEFLEDNYRWKTKPVFDRHIGQLANGSELTLVFSAKLPEHEVKAVGCDYGYQKVKVRTEEDMTKRGQCRILDVELGEKMLLPVRCNKK